MPEKPSWHPDAEARLKKVPLFVRKMARSKIEKAAVAQGVTEISVEFVEEIKNKEMK